jgi:hypothetical protein
MMRVAWEARHLSAAQHRHVQQRHLCGGDTMGVAHLGFMPSVQCAAVRTQLGATRAAPQYGPGLFGQLRCIDTKKGKRWAGEMTSPPTIWESGEGKWALPTPTGRKGNPLELNCSSSSRRAMPRGGSGAAIAPAAVRVARSIIVKVVRQVALASVAS